MAPIDFLLCLYPASFRQRHEAGMREALRGEGTAGSLPVAWDLLRGAFVAHWQKSKGSATHVALAQGPGIGCWQQEVRASAWALKSGLLSVGMLAAPVFWLATVLRDSRWAGPFPPQSLALALVALSLAATQAHARLWRPLCPSSSHSHSPVRASFGCFVGALLALFVAIGWVDHAVSGISNLAPRLLVGTRYVDLAIHNPYFEDWMFWGVIACVPASTTWLAPWQKRQSRRIPALAAGATGLAIAAWLGLGLGLAWMAWIPWTFAGALPLSAALLPPGRLRHAIASTVPPVVVMVWALSFVIGSIGAALAGLQSVSAHQARTQARQLIDEYDRRPDESRLWAKMEALNARLRVDLRSLMQSPVQAGFTASTWCAHYQMAHPALRGARNCLALPRPDEMVYTQDHARQVEAQTPRLPPVRLEEVAP